MYWCSVRQAQKFGPRFCKWAPHTLRFPGWKQTLRSPNHLGLLLDACCETFPEDSFKFGACSVRTSLFMLSLLPGIMPFQFVLFGFIQLHFVFTTASSNTGLCVRSVHAVRPTVGPVACWTSFRPDTRRGRPGGDEYKTTARTSGMEVSGPAESMATVQQSTWRPWPF